VADIRRLRGTKNASGFPSTLEHRGIVPRSAQAKALASAIGRLRSAESLPLEGDSVVEFWGAERCWAHRFSSTLWLYYRTGGSDENVVLMAVHDHVHEQ
jgi:hypothetical protein